MLKFQITMTVYSTHSPFSCLSGQAALFCSAGVEPRPPVADDPAINNSAKSFVQHRFMYSLPLPDFSSRSRLMALCFGFVMFCDEYYQGLNFNVYPLLQVHCGS